MFLIAHSEYELSEAEENEFIELVNRRARREPFQYIMGVQEFYGLDFSVTKDVLIPRPETELIVEHALEILPQNGRFCEIGVGSGCISVAILHQLVTAQAIGADISEKALRIAEKNAVRHQVADRLDLRISDVFSDFGTEIFDLIVSNPPYVSSQDISTLQAEVRDYEPVTALTDGRDGLSIIGEIVSQAPLFLCSKGFLLMEIGYDQAANVERLFSPEIWRKIEILPDLQGIPRMVKAQSAK